MAIRAESALTVFAVRKSLVLVFPGIYVTLLPLRDLEAMLVVRLRVQGFLLGRDTLLLLGFLLGLFRYIRFPPIFRGRRFFCIHHLHVDRISFRLGFI